MARRFFKCAGFASLIGLSGCNAPTVAPGIPGAAQIDMLTLISSDKTMFDHLMSWSSGKDCSSIYAEKGNHYCKEDEVVITPNVHCYKTLGRTTCYDQPDPFSNGHIAVGNNDHNLKDTKIGRQR